MLCLPSCVITTLATGLAQSKTLQRGHFLPPLQLEKTQPKQSRASVARVRATASEFRQMTFPATSVALWHSEEGVALTSANSRRRDSTERRLLLKILTPSGPRRLQAGKTGPRALKRHESSRSGGGHHRLAESTGSPTTDRGEETDGRAWEVGCQHHWNTSVQSARHHWRARHARREAGGSSLVAWRLACRSVPCRRKGFEAGTPQRWRPG